MAISTAKRTDHGIKLIHDITGAPRNLLHQVSVPFDGPEAEGFQYHHGWVDRDGFHWQLCCKELPVPKIGTGKPAEDVVVGLRVRTDGPMFAPESGTVVEIVPVTVRGWTEDGERCEHRLADGYRVRMDNGDETVTDLRQRCWRVA